MKHFSTRLAVALLSVGAFSNAALAQNQEDVMVVFDGSNSMWGQIDGTAKIDIARNVMSNLLGEWTEDRQVGLMAYGHRRRGDCSDIETLINPARGTSGDILARINGITPTGKTPLTDAVEQAARQLSYTDRPATVILISDGLESCDRDACAMARTLEKSGVGFTAHVVGFGLAGDADAASLACIAEETGGRYISASNATELGNALSAVGTAVAETAAAAPEPEPKPKPIWPDVALTAPLSAIAGSEFTVTWDRIVQASDYVTIVPVGADEGTYGNYISVGDDLEGALRGAPDPGMYEIRYLANAGGVDPTLGSIPIEITEPNVTMDVPDRALAGAIIPVAWTGTVHPSDYITIVPVGADEGTYGNYLSVSNRSKSDLQAPAEPGLYEVRYLLNIGDRTVARASIEIGEPEVTVSAPKTAQTGEQVMVEWTGTVAEHDYITVAPAGSDEGTYGAYFVVRDRAKEALQMPAEPGLYEIRYVLREDDKTMARQMIEIVEASVTLEAPDTALTGESVKVSWSDAVSEVDYITVVPVGADEGTYGVYFQVRDNVSDALNMPPEPGLYELRYVLNSGNRTAASRPIEIVGPDVTLDTPPSALAGQKFTVGWTGAVNPQDYITIVPMGADERTYGGYFQVRDNVKDDLQAPSEPGLYEVRYLLRQGDKTVARQPIEITEPTVELNAPKTAIVGQDIKISWTGNVSRHDYITIVAAGTDEGKFGNNIQVRDKTEGELQAFAEPGLYEIRYVLREGGRTLARASIELTEPEVTLDVPVTALTGQKFTVSWTGAVHRNDYITIVPAGSEEGTYAALFRVREKAKDALQAPAETGLYEVRYILAQGARTMARATIEITAPEVTLKAPQTALAGSRIAVTWTGAVDGNDFVTVVPMGADEGDYGKYFRVRTKAADDLEAPSEPGLYELRYVLDAGRKTMARQMIEITEPSVTITAPGEIRAGDTIRILWSGGVDADDFILIAPMGSPDNTSGDNFRIRKHAEKDLKAPDQPGLYEIRYILNAGRRVLARHSIEVLAADAALESGASLDVPETATPGSTIDVTWSVQSDSADQRITLARANQAIFTWISAVKIKGDPPVQINMPTEPGSYEIRFLDVSNQAVLARKIIKVQ